MLSLGRAHTVWLCARLIRIIRCLLQPALHQSEEHENCKEIIFWHSCKNLSCNRLQRYKVYFVFASISILFFLHHDFQPGRTEGIEAFV